MVDTFMIVGFALGIPATILGLMALFYGIKAANVFGGELGESLKSDNGIILIHIFSFIYRDNYGGFWFKRNLDGFNWCGRGFNGKRFLHSGT